MEFWGYTNLRPPPMLISDRKKGFQASLFKGNYQKNCRISSSILSRRSQSKIQNPKSGDRAKYSLSSQHNIGRFILPLES
jgi:hypothetical protein